MTDVSLSESGNVNAELHEALSAIACPYYRGVGECDQGCHMEPACQVNEPVEGWYAVIARGEALEGPAK